MKKGYTLAEVMVVIMVLGVIAAFLVPAIVKATPDRASMLYKKTFYSLQEATGRMINDTSLYPIDLNASPVKNGQFNDNTNFCTNLANTLNIIGTATCTKVGSKTEPNFTTTNGVKWWNVYGDFTQEGTTTVYHKDINILCGSKEYKIRIYNDGRVGTDADWNTENAILEQALHLQELPAGSGSGSESES